MSVDSPRIIIIFLDGVGLGDANLEANPFMHTQMPTVQALLGVPHLIGEVAGTMTDRAALLGLDAAVGVKGLPQSATGQTMILTGHNAPAMLGEHYGPYPNETLRGLLREDNLFKTLLEAGQPVAYANAYPERFLDRLRRGKGRLSANTQAAFLAGLKIRSGQDLQQGRALGALLTNEFWPEPDFRLPPLSARQAGQQLVALAQDHRLTFFEFWYTDLLGHKQKRAESIDILQKLDDFLAGIFESLDERTLFLVISDHGNFEDWTTNKHTFNPALTLVAGVGFQQVATQLKTLQDIKPALLTYLSS